MVYAILGVIDIRYVDKIIKLIEKVPELLAITGFLKSSLMHFGYKMTFKIIRIRKITPIDPKINFKDGCMS